MRTRSIFPVSYCLKSEERSEVKADQTIPGVGSNWILRGSLRDSCKIQRDTFMLRLRMNKMQFVESALNAQPARTRKRKRKRKLINGFNFPGIVMSFSTFSDLYGN